MDAQGSWHSWLRFFGLLPKVGWGRDLNETGREGGKVGLVGTETKNLDELNPPKRVPLVEQGPRVIAFEGADATTRWPGRIHCAGTVIC